MKRILETAAGILLAVAMLNAIQAGITWFNQWSAEVAAHQEAKHQRLTQGKLRIEQERRDAANEACRKIYAACMHTAAGNKNAVTACGKESLECHNRAGPMVYSN